MLLTETKLSGVYVIEIEPQKDERGFFARSWDTREFERLGLNPKIVQCSVSFNAKRGTLRGMHYQVSPYAEEKLVRCTMGAIYDVVLDLRPDSDTYKQWIAEELSAENHRALYIPEFCAHGFQTIVDSSEVYYQISEFFHPDCASGVRFDDPAFGIDWPIEKKIVSDKDLSFVDIGD